MKRRFILTKVFDKALSEYKNSSEILEFAENKILSDPDVGDTISSTGGLKKLRIPDGGRNKGTRGGYRVIYLDLPKKEVTYFITIYNKDELDDLSAEAKKMFYDLVKRLKGE